MALPKDQAAELSDAFHSAMAMWKDRGAPYEAEQILAIKRLWSERFANLPTGVLKRAIAKADDQGLSRFPRPSEIATFLPDEYRNGNGKAARHPGKESMRFFASVTYSVHNADGVPMPEQKLWGPFGCWFGFDQQRGFYDTLKGCNHGSHLESLECLQGSTMPPKIAVKGYILKRDPPALVELPANEDPKDPRVGFRERRADRRPPQQVQTPQPMDPEDDDTF